MIEIEVRGTRFEVTDPFGEPHVVIYDRETGYRGSYRADPRTDGKWFGDGNREVINQLSKENLDMAVAAARERAGAGHFVAGQRYLLVLKGGEAIIGTCLGPYAYDASSILMATDDREVAVMLRTIRTAVAEDAAGVSDKDKPLEAVRVRFSCGHSGGVWPEAAAIGSAHQCLECRTAVTVTAVIRSVS